MWKVLNIIQNATYCVKRYPDRCSQKSGAFLHVSMELTMIVRLRPDLKQKKGIRKNDFTVNEHTECCE